ncbi:M1 family metallopeptidase [Planotetraspora kaengkrachanensis]|uniref:Aminopeptidase N n=1 Tax=Planotetraspora kaengkrachanensis TaxID=575193 RepID=A0A8J3LZ68_9ACTN|nr:metallopeptidase [Planotetraspora kaengkrachanensis]
MAYTVSSVNRPLLYAVLVPALLMTGCTAEPFTPTSPASPVSASATPTPTGDAYAAWQAGRSTPVADPIYPERGTDALDVLHYDLALDWSPSTRVLTGTATLQVRPTKDAASFSLDFKPYDIDSLTVDGAPATGKVAKEKLTVATPVTADSPFTLVVAYHGRPTTTPMPSKRSDSAPLGLTVGKDGGLWTMQEPYGAFTWYPANDQPSDEALYDIAVTVPKGWSGIASGTPMGQDGDTFRYQSTDPVASYLTTLAVGKYKKAAGKGPHGLPLTYWYRPGDKGALPVLKQSPKYLAWLEKKFGPYPFPSGGVVMVDSESGMETQQMITLGSAVFSYGADQFELDVVHEYAHQWFGDAVTPADWRDLWLNEAWAQYAQLVYQKETAHATDAALDAWLRQSDSALRKEFGPPGHPRPSEFAMSNVYICGAAMLRQLQSVIGDKKFFALARDWAQDHRNTQQTRASFTAFVNEQTGQDFTAFIDAWLDSPTTPPKSLKDRRR